ncbi:MAG: hypothetical protein LBL05_01050 [Synergistaceae bacterium]|jgi:hypothetical protein|nr:hypothetical protein [Synergistaceae bacterium]
MMFFEHPEKVITAPAWNDGKILIYKNKIVVQRLCCDKGRELHSFNYGTLGIIILMISMMISDRFSGGSVSVGILVIPPCAIWDMFTYWRFKKKYIIDFKKGWIYKDYHFFYRSFAKISKFEINVVLSVTYGKVVGDGTYDKATSFFYKLSLPNDRYGVDFPISGPIKYKDSQLYFDFNRYAVNKFKSAGVSLYEPGHFTLNSFTENKKVTLGNFSRKELLGGINVNRVKLIYVTTQFCPQFHETVYSLGMIFEKISVSVLLENGKLKRVKHLKDFKKYKKRFTVNDYLCALRHVLGGEIKVLLCDDRFIRHIY